MMIVVANLRFAGFFALANGWIARRARHPLGLLAGVIVVSGGLSAFLVNDTVCLMLTPLVAELALSLRRNPVPYLLALAMASNIGSTATITGNPQNIMIGSFSHIAYGDFARALAPVAAAGLLVVFVLVALAWRREFLTRAAARGRAAGAALESRAAGEVARRHRSRMVLFFFLGQPPAKVGDRRRRAAAADAAHQAGAGLSPRSTGRCCCCSAACSSSSPAWRRRCSARRRWPMPSASIWDRRR